MHHTLVLLTVNSHYIPFKLVSSLFMYFSDLARILNHHVCKLELYSSIFMHWMDPPLTFNSHYCTPEFFCFILQILFLLSAVIITHPSCTLLHLCILQVCSSLIIAHLSSILVFLCIADFAIIVSSYRCPSKLYSCLFMHCTNFALTSTVIFASESSSLLISYIPQTFLSH